MLRPCRDTANCRAPWALAPPPALRLRAIGPVIIRLWWAGRRVSARHWPIGRASRAASQAEQPNRKVY